FRLVNYYGDSDSLFGRFGAVMNDTRIKSGGDDIIYKGEISGDVTYIEWDFGDGTTDNTTTQPIHQYDNTKEEYVTCLKAINSYTGKECYYCDTIVVPSITGINQDTRDEDILQVYPNPADHKFHVELTGLENERVFIQLINSQGIIQYHIPLTMGSKNYRLTLPCSKLDEGVYIIKLTAKDLVITRKIMVNH
ncbi:MAG: T9SS type A sorting domain-containing protein, partial [bacterium]